MSDYVTLLGSEDVRHAGSAMRQAAETIQQSNMWLVEALREHTAVMRELIERLDAMRLETTEGR